MASGILGRLKPSGGNVGHTDVVFTATTTTTLILSICNVSAAADTVEIALLDAGATSVTDADKIEKDYSLAANTAYERTGIVLGAGQFLVAGSGAGSIVFVAYGLES